MLLIYFGDIYIIFALQNGSGKNISEGFADCFCLFYPCISKIQRTLRFFHRPDRNAVGINHCRFEAGMAEQGLNQTDNQWKKLPEMLKHAKENKESKAFIYKRIWSETVPTERWQKILKKAQKECPNGGKEFCAEIIRVGKTTPNNQ